MLETRDVCVVSHMVCCCPLHTRATSSVNRIRKPRTPAYQFYLSKNETRRLRAPGEFSGSVEPHHLGVMVPPRGRGFSTRLCSIVKDACSKEFLREHTSDSLVMPSFLWILTTLATKSEKFFVFVGQPTMLARVLLLAKQDCNNNHPNSSRDHAARKSDSLCTVYGADMPVQKLEVVVQRSIS